jgi:Alpha/beta hydrolase domain
MIEGWRVYVSWCLSLEVLLLAMSGITGTAEARLIKIHAGPPTLVDLPVFGTTGPYLKISGTYEGEIDPADRRNSVIADIQLAPLTDGKVRYSTTFAILRPQNLASGNRKIFYDFGNRGNKYILRWFDDAASSNDPSKPEHFGNGFLMRQGYSIAWNGWDGDAPNRPNMMTIDPPVAKNADGSSITGMVVAETEPSNPGKTKMTLPYAASRTVPDNGVLTMRQHQTDPKIPVAAWSWTGPREISFPGPAHVEWIYEFVYEAKDPEIMGIGHAATRDFLSFLRYASKDDEGNENPLAMADGQRVSFSDSASNLAAIYSWGRSQGGRAQRDFLRLGFNEDEQGRIVIDGMMPYATGSGGNVWLNFRFAQPTVSAQQHSRRFSHEPELPHTLPVTRDPVTGETSGVLQACLVNDTCPKFFNIDGESEYWNKSNSLHHTDGLGKDLPVQELAPNARVYFISSIQHNTLFDDMPKVMPNCQQLSNPLYNGPVFRALAVALDQWVSFGVAPPDSVVPLSRTGTLVPPEAVHFPAIPATAYAGWPKLPAVQFNPAAMNVNVVLDFSHVPPAPTGKHYVTLVPQVDSDGNDTGGIRLPYLQAPLGSFTGWSLLKQEYGGSEPDRCDSTQVGQFIPFANTKQERLAAGDPRPSIEERYPNSGDYVRAVRDAAAALVRQRLLLSEDYDRMIEMALKKGTDLWKK